MKLIPINIILISFVFLSYSSEVGFYEAPSQSSFLPAHLQSCIQYKRMSYSAIRPSTSMRSRPQSEMRLPQVYVKQWKVFIFLRFFFRKTKMEIRKNNNRETDVYTNPEPLMHLKVCFHKLS